MEFRQTPKQPSTGEELTDRKARLRAEFAALRGYWNPLWDSVIDLDPDFFEAAARFVNVPWQGGSLEPKVRDLCMVVINASPTHLHEAGTREHIANALRHGASREEIFEVLQIASVAGIHSCTVGVPILLEELERSGNRDPLPALSAEQEEIKSRFVEARGFWAPELEAILALDPAYFSGYVELSSAPVRNGRLEPKVQALIFIAHSASITNGFALGVKANVARALKLGALPGEIFEVLEVVAALGLQACELGVPILLEEWAASGR